VATEVVTTDVLKTEEMMLDMVIELDPVGSARRVAWC
jgi:hypothetical protein